MTSVWFPAVAVCRHAVGALALWLVAASAGAETVHLLADAHTDSAAATTPAGSAVSLRVSPAGAAFLRFDLSALPAGMTVEQATLTVRPLRVLASGVVGAHAVTAEWNEDRLTHELRPTWNEAAVALQNVTEESAGGGDLTFGLTAAVASWLSGAPNHGIALVGDGLVDVDVASKENQTAAHPPRLEIVLVPAPATNP
jgi:hypothetical protein